MKKSRKYMMFFAVGGAGYGIIELLWRGHTHWSMVIAGGVCFIYFSIIAENFKRNSLIFKAMLCAFCITIVELCFGILFNLILKMNIWDYSDVPFNLLGQICPLYTLLWGALGFVFIPLAEKLNEKFNVYPCK